MGWDGMGVGRQQSNKKLKRRMKKKMKKKKRECAEGK